MTQSYIVAGRQSWNRKHFSEILEQAVGEWIFVSSPGELQECLEHGADWNYLFFLHWSERVPDTLLSNYDCVCFHMTDVPYGRGGTPMQNLIVRGHRETVLSALRMTTEFDAGPVYMKTPLSLEGSTAEEIYIRASKLSCEMALEIAMVNPKPKEQEGEPVFFKRRKPGESQLPVNAESLGQIYDHIRMLDAEDYPPAFLNLGKYRIEFCRSSLYDGRVEASVRIVLRKEEQ